MVLIKKLLILAVLTVLLLKTSCVKTWAACNCSDCFLHDSWGTCVCYNDGYEDCADNCCEGECCPSGWCPNGECSDETDCGNPNDWDCCCGCCVANGCPCPVGCFTSETKIATPGGEKEIKDVKAGDEVKSFSEQTNQETISVVEKIHEVTRSAYYKIKLKDGTEIKVTGEHPLWAIKKPQENLSFWGYLKTQSLTARLLKYFQGKN